MSLRAKINIGTLILVILVLFFSRHEFMRAWHLLGQVDILIFLLIIPAQALSYYASGAMLFSYLRAKGDLQNLSGVEAGKMALELNFVNHILPSGGVSGASYMTWRLSKLGISTGRGTLAQVVRFAAVFASFATLLIIAVLMVTFDGSVNRFIILVSSSLVATIVIGTLLAVYMLGSHARLVRFSAWVYRFVNGVWRRINRQRRELVSQTAIETFFEDLHNDYLALRREPQLLLRPYLWGLVFNVAETMMFFVTFLSFGVYVNPAPIFIGIGLAGLVGSFIPTPGGAGGYETAMILFLSTAGVSPGAAVAGVLLARVVLVLLTIASGYVFYNLALKKYGKHPV